MTHRNAPLIPFWFGVIAMVVFCFATTCRGEPLDVGGWRAAAASTYRAHRLTAEQTSGNVTNAVVQITISCPDGTSNVGSGTLIDWGIPGLVLSSAHVFRGATGRPGICVAGVGCVKGAVIGIDEANDLAAVRLDRPVVLGGYPGILVAESDPPIGSRIELWGMGSPKEQLEGCNGQVTGFGSFIPPGQVGMLAVNYEPGQRQVPSDGVLLISATCARQGDSGGPIVNSDGRLIGVLTGGNRAGGAGPCCRVIRAFLTSCCSGGGRRQSAGRPVYPGPAPIQTPGPCEPGGVPIGPWATSPLMVPVEPIRGEQGVAGERGEQGLQGDQGIPGEPGTISQDDLEIYAAGVAAGLLDNEKFIAAIAGLVKVEPSPDDIDAIADKVRQRISGEIHYEWLPETPTGDK